MYCNLLKCPDDLGEEDMMMIIIYRMHARSGVSPRYFSGLTLTKMRILSLAKFLVIFIKDNEDIKISFKNH